MDDETRRVALRSLRHDLRVEIWQLSRLMELPAPITTGWNDAALIETAVDLRFRSRRYARSLMGAPGRVA